MTITLLAITLAISVLVNFILGWYTTRLIKYVNLTSQDMKTFRDGMGKYQEHLETVYELPTFYGDETLKSLLQHTKDVSANVNEFIEINNDVLGENNG